jgi:hypothetical protein
MIDTRQIAVTPTKAGIHCSSGNRLRLRLFEPAHAASAARLNAEGEEP